MARMGENVKKIYPYKAVLKIGVLLILCSIFLLIIVGPDTSGGIKLFEYGLLFTLIICLWIFFTEQIAFDNEKIRLMPKGSNRIKKFVINIKDVIRIEIREFKMWGKFHECMFILFFDAEGEEGAVIINHNKYFIKDIKKLFNRLERYNNIPYLVKKDS
jgi:hypothetical protein